MKRLALLAMAGLMLVGPVVYEVVTNDHTTQVIKNTETWMATEKRNAADRKVAKRIVRERCRQASG